MKKYFHLLSATWFVWLGIAFAVQALTLEQSQQQIKDHLALQACQQALLQQQAHAQQVGNWLNPELELAAEDLGPTAGSDQNYQQWTFSLSQALPLTPRLQLHQQWSQAEVSRAALNCQLLQRELLWQVSEVYIEALYWQEQYRLMQQQEQRQQAFIQALSRQISLGKRAQHELIVPQSELMQMHLKQEQAEQHYRQAIAKLFNFWGAAPPAEVFSLSLQWPVLSELLPLQPTSGDLYVKEQEAKLNSAQLELAISKHELLPDLQLGSGLRWHPQSQELGVNLTIGWQLPLWELRKFGVAAAEAQLKKSALELQWVQQQRQLLLSQLQAQQQYASQSWQRYQQQLLPAQAEHLLVLDKSLKLGRVDLLHYLKSQQQHFELQQQALEAHKALFLAYVQRQIWFSDFP